MNIKITRHRKTPEVIDGHLNIDGSLKLCDTAENAVTALPAGQYKISIIKCKQHARKMPVILIHKDIVPNCDHCDKLEFVSNNTKMPCICPMLKPGNGVYHREDGSIIVGTFIAPGCLSHPKAAFDALYDRIRKSAERQKQREQNRARSNSAESRPDLDDSQRGHEITLTIEENYPLVKRTLTNYELGQQILKQF